MEYFVSPSGDDDRNSGTQEYPFLTIGRGLRGASPALTSRLVAGDILTLRAGTYVEAVTVSHMAGTPGNEITIRSFPGERAVIDSGVAAFRQKTSPPAWSRAITVDPKAHPDEWVSEKFPKDVKPNQGAFLDMPYRRLVTYSTIQDFRSNNQTSDKMFDVDAFDENRGPWKVTDETHGSVNSRQVYENAVGYLYDRRAYGNDRTSG